MILKRLAEAIREQNWFTVVLEVMIVVVGIFIGLQVDDWNEDRKERAEEQIILENLRIEIDNNIESYRATSEALEAEQALYVSYYDYLTGARDGRPDKEDLLGVLCRVGLGQEAPYDNTVYEELIQTGRTTIIRDEEVRAALSQYKRVQDRREAAFEDVVPIAKDQFTAIQQFLDWRPFTPDDRYGNCGFDFAAFEADERAAHHIGGAQRIAYFYKVGTESVLGQLLTLRTAATGH
jgi:hypothetical protein